ncbi:MAG TPA: carbohydrate-binding family V/XII, partial [Methylomirabilota bacterium]|nr:carbohydrate-binding family V/XII [Methylomirabilota bacterium]
MTTLLFLGAHLAAFPAWAQAPSMPASGAPVARPAPGGTPAVSAAGAANAPWPRELTEGDRTYTVYQPQIEKWDGTRLHARAAFSVETKASPLERFGVVWYSARADVDRVSRQVALTDFRIEKVAFPSEPGRAAEYQTVLERRLPQGVARISLDRVQAELAITEAQAGGATPREVKNDPPRVVFSATPAILVRVDGKPVLRQVDGSSLVRVVNSWALILVDQKVGKHYLRAVGRWFEASTLDGPWTAVPRAPAGVDAAMQAVAKGERVNLLDDAGPEVQDALTRGLLPTIHVSTVPAELIQTRGRPDYEPIEGTDLLHVRNSSANILLDPTDQRHYVPLSGRWFRSASLTEGPWEYVAHDKLPAAFAKIPDGHPRGAVLASVPGTPQAKEALIDNSIPQTAEVSRATTTYRATYEGAARFEPIEGTALHYAVNSPVPVIQVDSRSYYSLKDGVWFMATAPTGPWTVATTVPAAIYTIPVSSPLYYVTYVRVYGSTPQTVSVGYTPGYYGTVVAPANVVVYGTGYVYPPLYVGSYWYPYPTTYGYGAGFGWGAVTGFAFGAITAGVWGGAWGCCGYGDVDIDRNVNINRNDAYNRWNQSQVRSNLESRAQSLNPQQRQQAQQRVQQRAQDRGISPRSNDV